MAEGKQIAISSDHAGFQLKAVVVEHLKKSGHEVIDLGPANEDRVDYPDFGFKLAEAIAAGQAPLGIAICGSGIGISIAVNRYKGMRCALAHDVTSARLSRLHNDANVLALGARLVGVEVALDCVNVFLSTAFEGGRHAGRVEKLGKCGA
ncbi:MAG: ribose-5-phosphate isomerase [Alphaproteobacteria bacterium]|nr:ribose-5-phosphate isomerase [Alphaproteobacteria bacterium]